MEKSIIIATSNKHKAKEYSEMLSPLGYNLKTLDDFKDINPPIEDGKSFRENSCIKAKSLQNAIGLPVIADDSGLEILALNGFPGIYSSRYADKFGGDYKKTCASVLKMLEGEENRNARFQCCICLHDGEKPLFFEGICEGYITKTIVGEGGFGYDPIFHADELNIDFGNCPQEEKNKISHRKKALDKLIAYLDKESGR